MSYHTFGKRLFLPLLAGILISLAPGSSCLGDEISLFANEYKPPKVYLKNGEPAGILVDILRYIDHETGHSFKIELYPWKRAYKKAEQGSGGIFGFSKNAERLKIFDYSEVIFYDEILLVVLKGRKFPFKKVEDLAGKRVGAQKAVSYGDEFERGKREIFTLIEDDGPFQRFKKLLSKRIDAAVISPGKAGLNYVLKDYPLLLERRDDFVVLARPLAKDPNYLGFAKSLNMQEFLKEFNQILQNGYQNGTIPKIIDSYAEYR